MIQTRPSRFVLLAVLCAILACFATEAGAEVRNPHGVAVIVGNKDYRHRDIPAVSFAHRDADAFRRYVVDVLGFNPENVIDLRDATRAKLLRTFGREQKKVSDLWAKLLPDQKWDVVVFYSGHGVPGLTDGKGYLLPVDVSPRAAQEEGYPLDLLYEKLGSLANARSVQVYLDACFSGASDGGPLVRGASPVVVRPALPKGLTGKVTAVSASGADQIASWDVKARHGLFTHHLLDALYGKGDEKGDRDGKVTAREVKTYLDGYMTRAAWLQYGREQDANVMGAPGIVLASAPPGGFPKRPSLKGAPSVSSPPARGVAVTEPFALDRKKKVLVQRGLASLKFDPGPADGDFGPKTREAIRGWQKAKGYEETGRLTKEQADALAAAGKSRRSAPSGEAEREFWASVKESKSPSDLEAYLKAYPEGEYAVLARFRRDKLVGLDDGSYARARSAGTAESYGEYLSSYPQGRHVGEVYERLKEAKAREREEAERLAREVAERERKAREARKKAERERKARETRAKARAKEEADHRAQRRNRKYVKNVRQVNIIISDIEEENDKIKKFAVLAGMIVEKNMAEAKKLRDLIASKKAKATDMESLQARMETNRDTLNGAITKLQKKRDRFVEAADELKGKGKDTTQIRQALKNMEGQIALLVEYRTALEEELRVEVMR